MAVKTLVLQGKPEFNAVDVEGVHIDAMFLGIATAETYTLPTDCRFVEISSDGEIYARYDGSAAAIPTTEITDGTGSELIHQVSNPVRRYVGGIASISFISAAAQIITICAYK